MRKVNSRSVLPLVILLLLCLIFKLQAQKQYVFTQPLKGRFNLSAQGKTAPLYASADEFPGVIRALRNLQSDLEAVTGVKPSVFTDKAPEDPMVVVAGTIGKSKLIDQLIANKKINTQSIAGKWETYLIQVVENPFPKVLRAFVIAGSDKRGTIFGIYDVSKQIGVSPWSWWADVPVQKSKNLYVQPGTYTDGEPKVKYRGIFINDEAPALSGWVAEKFPSTPNRPQGFNHLFYEKVYELILRMKGNYLWPAMWGRAIYDDDSLSAGLADEYGVVIGTSHHEPMMRAHVEWQRYGTGDWNYTTNATKLQEFWIKGIERMGKNESIVSLGMRGDGDKAMSPDPDIPLLEKIVKDQREIIATVSGKDIKSQPQLWALYKEVQDYYDKGMRVPDDVTLLLCDDNWGNIRKLPNLSEAPRAGGYGIYYHYDYVGGPRNYKWINTNQVSRIWEQMNMAYQYGATRIWVVNVGDIKPMEFPIEFFLDFAWNPERWTTENIGSYTEQWVKQQFGNHYAKEIAALITSYTKFNSRRKPELLSPDSYSLFNYREAETIVSDYNKLLADAVKHKERLKLEYKDAFYQLVLHPIEASANLNEMYLASAKNFLYARQGRASANDYGDLVKKLFAKDAEITNYYNKVLAGGKWNHMMDQTHIGYTNWQQPTQNKMPDVKTIEIPDTQDMGVAIEGTDLWWPNEKTEAFLPDFDGPRSKSFIEIFNRGLQPFKIFTKSDKPWIKITPEISTVEKEARVEIGVDWSKVPAGDSKVIIRVTSENGQSSDVYIRVFNRTKDNAGTGFTESNGFISIEAEHFAKSVNGTAVQWKVIPDLGRTLSGVSTFPVTAAPQSVTELGPHLEYQVIMFAGGSVNVKAYFSPTLNYNASTGLRYAISFDDETPVVVNMHEETGNRAWESWVANNIIIKSTNLNLKTGGQHTLKFWRVDPGVVLQKIVIDRGGLKPSYLGPPESYFKDSNQKKQVASPKATTKLNN